MTSRTLFSWLMAYSAAGDFPENLRRLFLDQPQGVAVGVADHHRLLETELGLRLRRYGHHARADERHARLAQPAGERLDILGHQGRLPMPEIVGLRLGRHQAAAGRRLVLKKLDVRRRGG